MKKFLKWTTIVLLGLLLAPIIITVVLYIIAIREDIKHLGEEHVSIDKATGKPVVRYDHFDRTVELTMVLAAGICALPTLMEEFITPYWNLFVFRFQVEYGYLLASVESYYTNLCDWYHTYFGFMDSVIAFLTYNNCEPLFICVGLVALVFIIKTPNVSTTNHNAVQDNAHVEPEEQIERVKDYEILDGKYQRKDLPKSAWSRVRGMRNPWAQTAY